LGPVCARLAPGRPSCRLPLTPAWLSRLLPCSQWKKEHNLREVQTMRRYHIQDRDDYKKYNKLCGLVTKLVRC